MKEKNTKRKRKSIGIIGFGRFGQLVAEHLKKHGDVFVCNKNDKSAIAKKIGVKHTSIEECASKDIVILCTPISTIEDVLKTIKPHLKEKCIVFDTCSVKEIPVKLMEKHIPKECEIIATHPLFGPDTTKDGLEGRKIALCPVRTTHLTEVKEFLEKLGLTVIITTPSKHDEMMARTLNLIHFLGRGLLNIGIEKTLLSTPTHERLIELVDIVKNDSKQLFIDMNKFNKHCSKVRKQLIKELTKADEELNKEE